MKKRILSIVALAALVALPMSVFAAEEISNEEASTASAKIVTPLTFNKDNDGQKGNLVFGAIAQGATSSTVTVAATSTATSALAGGDAVILSNTTYPSNSAHFSFKGQADYDYKITTNFPTTLSNSASETIAIGSWTTSIAVNETKQFSGSLEDLYVGATITVPASTTDITSPDFTGNFTVTIAYN